LEAILQRLSGQRGPGDNERETEPVRLVLIAAADSGDPQDDKIDLIHETLLRTDANGEPYWPTLWKEIEDTDFLSTRMRLERQARAWRKDPQVVPLARGRELGKFKDHRPNKHRHPLIPMSHVDGSVRCKERLGGLLKYYHREAA